MIRKLALIGAVSALALGMAGCDDDDAAPAAAAAFLSGTAAVGAPIPNGTVTAACTGATVNLTATTAADGTYSISSTAATEASATIPCALRITATGFPTLFSIARNSVDLTTNITPLTSLAVERAAGDITGGAAAWFNGGASFTAVTLAELTTATNAVQNALLNAIPAASRPTELPFNIFATRFTADSANAYDIFLDAFWTSAGGSAAGYQAVANTFATATVSNFGGSYVITLPEGYGSGTLTSHICVTSTLAFNIPTCTDVVTQGVAEPASSIEFCAAYTGELSYPGVTVNCSFVNGVGTLSGSVTTPAVTVGGITVPANTTSYTYTYTWTDGTAA